MREHVHSTSKYLNTAYTELGPCSQGLGFKVWIVLYLLAKSLIRHVSA